MKFVKSVQSAGPENIDPERTLPGLLAPRPALNSHRITIENKGKNRLQRDGENAFAKASGGGNGFGVKPSPPLKNVPSLHLSKTLELGSGPASLYRQCLAKGALP